MVVGEACNDCESVLARNNFKLKSEAVRAESRARPRLSGNAERREQGEDLRGVRCATVRGKWDEIWRGAGCGLREPVYPCLSGWNFAGPGNRPWRWRGRRGAVGPSMQYKHSYFVIFYVLMFITVSLYFVCVYLCMRVRAHTHSMECCLLGCGLI